MASGDSLFTLDPLSNRPPASDFATVDVRGDFVVLDFDDAVDEQAQFQTLVPSHYQGGSLIAIVTWTSSSAVTGNAKLRVELVRLAAGANLDVPPAPSGSADLVVGAPVASGDLVVSTTASMAVSGLASGDILQVLVTRLATDAVDTMVGDIELIALELREA